MTDWPSIVRQHGPLVWRVASRLLTHDADARDCFQQTFLAAVEWDGKARVRDWPAALRRIATARALDLLRARYRWRRNDPLPDGVADPDFDDPADSAAVSELSDQLRHALTEIDPTQASAFALVCLDGLSNSEAAVALDVSANHLGVLLFRARQALREKLTAFDPAAEREVSP
jgi:RNA polymerase sigma-70 factor (ECF subfamily)